MNKFLDESGANLSDGTAVIYAATLGAANLEPSMPVKTNATKQLISSRLDISDVTGLQTSLNSKISNPLAGEFSSHSYVATQGNPNKRIRITEDAITSDNGTTMDFATTDTIDLQATNVLVNGAVLASAADVAALQTKTQNQTATVGTTTFTGAVVASTISDVGSTVSITTAPNFLTLTAPFITVHGDIDMGQNQIVDVGYPTSEFDAANREYVDDQKGVTSVYTTNTLPTAVGKTGQIVYVSNEGNMAFSNGSTWIRMANSATGSVQPAMTSDTTPAPFVVTTNSTEAPWVPWKGFDGVLTGTGNWWHTFTGAFSAGGSYIGAATGKTGVPNQGTWLVLEFNGSVPIRRYQLYPRFDNPSGNAKSWHIIYSTDGVNYSVADTKVTQTMTAGTPVDVTFTNPIYAKYWGVQVYESQNPYMIIQELRFIV